MSICAYTCTHTCIHTYIHINKHGICLCVVHVDVCVCAAVYVGADLIGRRFLSAAGRGSHVY